MQKSAERRAIEQRIRRAVGDDAAYFKNFRKIEGLDPEEGYPGMRAYAIWLDMIRRQLPKSIKNCYYPYSGVDFYWARIFKRLVCEDLGFNNKAPRSGLFWRKGLYRKRRKIIALLRKLEIIPSGAKIQCLASSFYSGTQSRFNLPSYALLIYGPSHVMEFLRSQFDKAPMRFGAVINVGGHSSLRAPLTKYLAAHGYRLAFSRSRLRWIVPYVGYDHRDGGRARIFLKAS